MGQFEASADLAVWRDRRPRRGVVYGTVLRSVLPAEHPEGEPADVQYHHCGGAAPVYAVLYRLWGNVRQNGSQEAHDGGLPDRGGYVFADLPRHAAGCGK